MLRVIHSSLSICYGLLSSDLKGLIATYVSNKQIKSSGTSLMVHMRAKLLNCEIKALVRGVLLDSLSSVSHGLQQKGIKASKVF